MPKIHGNEFKRSDPYVIDLDEFTPRLAHEIEKDEAEAKKQKEEEKLKATLVKEV